MIDILKIFLALLLFLCLLKMPYGYYLFIRFIALLVFGILAYQAYKQERQLEMVVYGALALLFQPFLKISLGRDLWNIIDVIVGIGLIVSLLKKEIRK
ncbi:hypothetical protein D0T60_10415 [Bacteroides sp. 224]|nr:hypothetical protein [Bacteroides sp. 224]